MPVATSAAKRPARSLPYSLSTIRFKRMSDQVISVALGTNSSNRPSYRTFLEYLFEFRYRLDSQRCAPKIPKGFGCRFVKVSSWGLRGSFHLGENLG